MLRLGEGVKSHHFGFCVTKKSVPELGGAVFLNMNGAQQSTVRLSIGAPDVVWRVVKHTVSNYFKTGKILR